MFRTLIHYLRTLKELGGVGTTADVIDKVIERLNIPDDKVEETIPSGQSRVRNRIQWARMYLVKAGLLDASKRGVWKLTDRGFSVTLTEQQSLELFKDIHKSFSKIDERKIKESNSRKQLLRKRNTVIQC